MPEIHHSVKSRRERERERERETERQRERERERDTHTHTHTHRQISKFYFTRWNGVCDNCPKTEKI